MVGCWICACRFEAGPAPEFLLGFCRMGIALGELPFEHSVFRYLNLLLSFQYPPRSIVGRLHLYACVPCIPAYTACALIAV